VKIDSYRDAIRMSFAKSLVIVSCQGCYCRRCWF